MQGDAWSQVNGWVVFSDLHVSTRTLPVCLEVLRRVHREATERNAGVEFGFWPKTPLLPETRLFPPGILFLGDFWHERGSLPVLPLNAVLGELASWTQPALFLVGNHDQVSLGGDLHALDALARVNPHRLHIFTSPALYLDALWLPYRRTEGELRQAIAQATAAPGRPRAIFAHVDLVGAHMNESFQSFFGLPSGIFPGDIPTYSGHYHLQHQVPGAPHILYVGSPYQLSMSEAGQDKSLVLLDTHWRDTGRVPLDLGPRHFPLDEADSTRFLESIRVKRGGWQGKGSRVGVCVPTTRFIF